MEGNVDSNQSWWSLYVTKELVNSFLAQRTKESFLISIERMEWKEVAVALSGVTGPADIIWYSEV
jgi:hypothetical protein